VFRFRYATAEAAGGEDVNDFRAVNSPFLAFAARCTSAFPFAFEPMRLDDIKAVVESPAFRPNYTYDPSLWRGFYKDYLQGGDTPQSAADFEKRSFGDGGYLDNKPFSYVTDTLLRRRADLPVDRKLIYIEPAPEHPAEKDVDVRPNALQNVAVALLTLPRYETIREDLQAITQRNQLIERIEAVLKHIRHVSRATLAKQGKAWQLGGTEWAKLYLDDKVLSWYGPGYAAYHQLRVASLLDDLSSGLLRAMGLDENSDQARAFRQETMEGWRQAYYRIDPGARDERKSENDLLFRLDLGWRIRRLQFMQVLIDDLLDGLADPTPDSDDQARQEARIRAQEIVRDSQGKDTDWPLFENTEGADELRPAFRHMLMWSKARFNDAYKDLRAGGRLLRSRSILALIEKGGEGLGDENLQSYGEQLRALKEALEGGASKETLYAILENLSVALASGEAQPAVKGAVRALTSANARLCKQILGQEALPDGAVRAENSLPPTPESVPSKIQACLSYYYDRFEYYDMLTFPLFYGTEVGESDVVEIIRISPEDAPSLRPASQKLAGTKLGNFGAFFVRGWRENDILWGRLDGAECLINALLPGDEHAATRAALIEEAHQAILNETFLAADRAQLFEALKSGDSTWLGTPEGVKDAFLRAMGGPRGMLEHFKREYRIDMDFPPETTLKISSRASRVTGKLLAELSSKYPAALSSPAGMVARLGQLFNGLVQVALPQSLPNLIFNSLVWLLYPLELLLALGGKVFGLPDVSTLGAIALGATLGAHLGVLYLQAILKRNLPALRVVHGLIKLLAVLAVATLVFLVYLGLVYLGLLQLPSGLLGSWLQGLRS
jgi:patatin-related protein